MDTEKLAVTLNRRLDGQILAIDEGRDACVFYLRNRRRVSINLADLAHSPEAAVDELRRTVEKRRAIL
ncbi:hypothetical protein [Parapusillimonas granuli]|uniref:Uncharacterized protein n=1 Tax=Parapusillimonas granuli TaxID=380911 RepID=A0A853G669_9BURK|nr:hypothetical protein [Parapusillimonas granuli]MBB5217152.1 hypothetical protein [Parapusillimonas granuli]MEB2401616.1 hypothetical protein [Alcaligenaceae bacterium]NYT50086.1 hypothetical protein [Parapusillimonas granuli]